jgi:replicative DNA helicase
VAAASADRRGQRISAEGLGDVGGVQEFIDGAEQSVYELARTVESGSAQP